MKVSVFPNIKAITGGKDADLLAVIEDIRSGKWRAQVEAVRAVEDKVERRAFKKLLPYFTVSGLFTKRGEDGMRKHSGYVAADIDHDLSKREEIAADPYTFACVVSAGGDGFFTIVKIPPDVTVAEHNASFRALQRYYDEQYGVKIDSLPDVSRARFVTYDPDLFLNTESKVFTDVWHEPVQKPDALPQMRVQPSTKASSAGQNALNTAVRKIREAPDGEKHETLKKMSYLCGGYVATGLLTEPEATEALRAAISQRANVESLKDAFSTIASGIRKGQEKPLLPESNQTAYGGGSYTASRPALPRDSAISEEVEYMIRQKKRNGFWTENIVAELSVAKGIAVEKLRPFVEAILSEERITIEKFWVYTCEDEAKDKWKLTFFHNKYIAFLREAGFGMFKEGDKFHLVRVVDNIVQHVSRKDVKDYVQVYIDSLPFEFDGIYRVVLEDKIKREHLVWFSEGTMEWLPNIGKGFHRDTREHAFFYFRNGFVQVGRKGYELKSYAELDGMIWETQIIDRDFVKWDVENIDLVQEKIDKLGRTVNFDFYRFCFNICGNDIHRLMALLTSLGYLMHSHKLRTHAFAIILCDESIGKGPSGRTGKGILIQALKHIRNTVTIDGRNFRIENQFAYQRVQADTNLIAFDDVDPKRLPFERLFSILTEGLSVERKQAGEVLIPFDEAPKIIITTNETVIGEGDSYAGRMRELELAPFYSASFTPEDEFGRILFDDWPAEEWQLFDNFMMHCTQLYLERGVVRQKQINLNKRKLIQKTCKEFAEFMQTVELDRMYGRGRLYADFIEAYGFDKNKLTLRTFNRWLSDWAYYEGLVMSKPEREPNLGPGTYRDYLVSFTQVLKIAN